MIRELLGNRLSSDLREPAEKIYVAPTPSSMQKFALTHETTSKVLSSPVTDRVFNFFQLSCECWKTDAWFDELLPAARQNPDGVHDGSIPESSGIGCGAPNDPFEKLNAVPWLLSTPVPVISHRAALSQDTAAETDKPGRASGEDHAPMV